MDLILREEVFYLDRWYLVIYRRFFNCMPYTSVWV